MSADFRREELAKRVKNTPDPLMVSRLNTLGVCKAQMDAAKRTYRTKFSEELQWLESSVTRADSERNRAALRQVLISHGERFPTAITAAEDDNDEDDDDGGGGGGDGGASFFREKGAAAADVDGFLSAADIGKQLFAFSHTSTNSLAGQLRQLRLLEDDEDAVLAAKVAEVQAARKRKAEEALRLSAVPSEMVAKFQAVCRGPASNNDTVVAEHHTYRVRQKDIKTLTRGTWLNDEVVNAFFRLLEVVRCVGGAGQ
jgi:hypothetical protein